MELNQEDIKRLRALQRDRLHELGMRDSHGAFCATCGFPAPCEGALVREGLRRAAAALARCSAEARAYHWCDECGGSAAPDSDTWEVKHERGCFFAAAQEALVFPSAWAAAPRACGCRFEPGTRGVEHACSVGAPLISAAMAAAIRAAENYRDRELQQAHTDAWEAFRRHVMLDGPEPTATPLRWPGDDPAAQQGGQQP